MVRLHPLHVQDGLPPSLAAPAGGEACPATTLDDSLWPLLVVRFGADTTEREFERYLAARLSYLEREQPHVVLLDTRELHMPPMRMRQRYIDWLREHASPMRQWVLGTACVIASPVVVMMMSVIRHCASLSTPFVVTKTLPPAAAWAAERLYETGLTQDAKRLRAHYAIPAS